jgi:hypothetical protein
MLFANIAILLNVHELIGNTDKNLLPITDDQLAQTMLIFTALLSH